jgi:hypothetical protein
LSILTNCIIAADVKARELHLHTASFLVTATPKFTLVGNKGKDAAPTVSSSKLSGNPVQDFYFSSAGLDYESRFVVDTCGGDGERSLAAVSNGVKGGTSGNGGKGGNIPVMHEDNYQLTIEGYYPY